ncbi:MAG TPA: 3-dehydroquinate synthase [Terriglobales bacterium]|nr:3-dehydroquinate synthase [Terriglobales bacterium]
MIRVDINIPSRAYPALIESGLLRRSGTLLREIFPERQSVMVVTVAAVRRRWGKQLASALKKGKFVPSFIEMPDGERFKTLKTVEGVAEKLLKASADRKSILVAFGGGVVGDVAGLLASLYMRGLDFVQVPSTLLAQVDAAVGGKTGVDLRQGKNLLGTFHHPRLVVIDPQLLSTLPEREFRAGLFEVLKCGVIRDPAIFEFMEQNRELILRRDAASLERVISASVKVKADVVAADERESGLRRILNFGHTLGHALEAETGYRKVLHGEAVAWGMVAATMIAEERGRLDKEAARRIISGVQGYAMWPKFEVPARNIYRRLAHDKKTLNGVVHFVLPTGIGSVDIACDVPERVVMRAIEQSQALTKAV